MAVGAATITSSSNRGQANPNKLAEAVQHKTHRVLAPGERFVAEVAATVYRSEEGYEGALRRLES